MKVIDLNILIYAVNADAPNHEKARIWWENSLSETETIGLSWSVLLGFLRITTNPRIMPIPIAYRQAIDTVDNWLKQAPVQLVTPTDRHWTILKQLLGHLGTAANITTDSHLAALAIERGATLISTDPDFARFPNLKWDNPLS